jgi:hypothetical protein
MVGTGWQGSLVRSRYLPIVYLCNMVNRQSILPVALRFGFFCGTAHAVLIVAILSSGSSLYHPATIFAFVITFIFILRCVRSIRENEGEGFISFKHAMVSGAFMCFFAFLLLGLVEYILGATLFPNMLEMSKNEMLRNIEAAEFIMSESQIERYYDDIEKLTLAGLTMNDAASKFFWGLLLSLILALSLRRKRPIQP